MSVLPPIEEKSTYVEQMFANIAPGYDRMNRLLTFGMDQTWREITVAAVAPPACGYALDVGCGTGDFVTELAAWTPDGKAVGIDYTIPMMQAGHTKIAPLQHRATFVGGDALQLPFPDETFDTITTGFVMRNVVDIQQAFAEMWRVARPRGMVACLEVARPNNALLRFGHRMYFERVVPILAGLVGADTTAYTYLPQSARQFPTPDILAHIMQEAGWQDVSYRLLGLGAVALHIARKDTV